MGLHLGMPTAVLQSRVPVPQGLCAGQGLCLLPGSTLSLPGVLPNELWGEAVGGRSDSQQGRVFMLSRECCIGQGCSQLHITPRIFPRRCLKEKIKTRIAIKIRSFPESAFQFPMPGRWGAGGAVEGEEKKIKAKGALKF